MRDPWIARRSNQSILKEIIPEYSLKGVMLKLKLQYFGHLVQRDPDARKDWGRRRGGDRGWVGWMASLTQWTWIWTNSKRQWRTGKPGVLQSMWLPRASRDLATEQQQEQSDATNKKQPVKKGSIFSPYKSWNQSKTKVHSVKIKCLTLYIMLKTLYI